MDLEALRQTVFDTLHRIAPEVDGAQVEPRTPLRDQVDLDSMDWLNFLLALHAKLGVDIPESDYARLVTLEDLLTYLKRKL